MRQFLQILWVGCLCLQVGFLVELQAQCPPIAGADSLLCGFTTTLTASPEGGIWSIVCDESAGVVEFEDASSAETSVTVSECGTYTFVYTMNTPECAAEDTVKIGFEDPSQNVALGSFDVGLEVDYDCPSGGSADCSNTISISGVGPPTFDWSMDLIQECCPMLYETIVENPLGDCEAQNIAVNILTPDECTVSEANWAGNQGDLVNVDSVLVTANFFDIFLPLLGEGACDPIGGECSFEDLGDVCQPDTLSFGADTLIVEIPYSTGGRWHYVVNADSLLALQDTTQLPPPYDFATLIIEPNAEYVGPNSVTFSAWESGGEGALVPLFSQPLELSNKIQWVYEIEYVNDTLITNYPICESGNCHCGCNQSGGFFPTIAIPSLDLSCPPISLSFNPPGFGEVFAFYPNTVFCEDETSTSPFIDSFGCPDFGYVFSGSDGLAIDPSTGEIFIDQSNVGTFEVYFSSGNGEFSVTVIDILPIEIVDFTLPASFETCEGNGDTIQPTFTGGSSSGTWDISGSGVIDPSTGTIDVEASGSGNFTVTFTPSGPCAYTTSQDIDLTIGASSPSIDVFCASTIDAISFNWSPIEGASSYDISYSINGGSLQFSSTNGTDFQVSGLLPGDFVSITVEALGNSICGDSAIGSSDCNTSECPPLVIEIMDLNPLYCSDIANIELTATPAGGIFFGNGVENNAFFNPAAAGVGIHTIQYEYTDFNGCSYSDNVTIEVVEPLEAVEINCGEVGSDMVSFNWSEVVGYDFEVTYSINGEETLTNTSSDNFLVINDLNPEDMVELIVVVLNEGICGNSFPATAMCTAQACDPLILSIDNLADTYCSNEEFVALQANIAGGTFYINGNESSVFEPAILGEGSHLVEYVLEQNGCMYDVESTLEVIEPLEAVLVECGEITDNSITFNWSESANAAEYQVVLSGAISDNFIQTATTYTIENLTAMDALTIEVTAIGTIDCANSAPATASCTIPLIQECMTASELNQALVFPNAFSPNQDGVNDSFYPVFPYAFSDYKLIIYNRWGKEVFGSQDVGASWNGVQSNTFKEAALGVYVWHLKATVANECGEEIAVERKGNVTLVR